MNKISKISDLLTSDYYDDLKKKLSESDFTKTYNSNNLGTISILNDQYLDYNSFKLNDEFYSIDDISCIFDSEKIGTLKNPIVEDNTKKVEGIFSRTLEFPSGLERYGYDTLKPVNWDHQNQFKPINNNTKTVPVITLSERSFYESEGSMIFNKDNNILQIYVGSSWINLN